MQVKPEELQSHLSRQLAPVYLVSGDETLLVEECCDAIVSTARQHGFTERSVHHGDTGFKWHDVFNDAASMSLFADKKIIDLRLTPKKFDKEGSAFIREWLGSFDTTQEPEQIVIMRCARLEPRQRNAAWFKAIDGIGVVSLIWPMSPNQMPRWLKMRLENVGLSAQQDALIYLADKVEGNLLAAAQEVHKLSLLVEDPSQPISLQTMVDCLEDASRYNVFDLLDATMGAQPQRISKIVAGLREEGVSQFAILGALTSQIRNINSNRRLPPARQKLLNGFASRLRQPELVLTQCSLIDQMGKGQLPGDAWVALERLLLRLAGVRSVSLPSEDMLTVDPYA